MSKQALDAFKGKLTEDETLRLEMTRVLSAGGTKSTVSVEELVDFAKSHGYEFSADEALASMDLSDQALDGVVGGAGATDRSRQALPSESLSLNFLSSKMIVGPEY